MMISASALALLVWLALGFCLTAPLVLTVLVLIDFRKEELW